VICSISGSCPVRPHAQSVLPDVNTKPPGSWTPITAWPRAIASVAAASSVPKARQAMTNQLPSFKTEEIVLESENPSKQAAPELLL